MKKKWLCLFVCGLLLLLSVTGLNRIEAKQMLARALTGTGGASSYETMLALGSVALNRAGGTSLDALGEALDGAGFARALMPGERALNAAQALIAGERALDAGVIHFSQSPPEAPYERVGAFYFY